MGYALTPEFYKACECAFHSLNPIFPGEILLDMYYVTIQDKDKNGEIVGEREIPCVTHESLMRYYRENLMLKRTNVFFEPTFSDPMVVKCTIVKALTPTDIKNLINFYPNATAEDFGKEIHIEAIGEATVQNSKSEIAQKHLANTAENRAFDRAMIKLLSLDTKEQVYGSSDEIGDCGEDVKKIPATKDWLDKAKETIADSSKGKCEQMQMPLVAPVVETAPVVSESQPAHAAAPAQPAKSIPAPIAPEHKSLGSYNNSIPLHTMINAINGIDREPGYDETLLEDKDNKSSVYNGKTIKQLVASLKEGDKEAAEKLYKIVVNTPCLPTDAPAYINLVQYLIDSECLVFDGGNLVIKGG